MIALKIIAVIIVLLALQMFIKNSKTPSNLGVKDGKLAPVPKSPNAVSSQCDNPEKKVDPIPFISDLDKSKESIKSALKSYGGIEIIKEDDNYIHAISTTKTMKYKDDLEFYFDVENKIIQFRSASRVGYSDRGLNRDRYNKMLNLLD